MKKPLLIVLLASAAFSLKAQVYVDGKNLNADSSIRYIEIVHYAPPVFFFNINYIDFGQRDPSDSRFTDANGKKFKINSPVHLLTYMQQNGWWLLRRDISPVSNSANVYLLFERAR